MKFFPIFFLLSIYTTSCQNRESKTGETSVIDSTTTIEENTVDSTDTTSFADTSSKQHLVLTANALQVVDAESGSSREISFGREIDEVIEVVNNLLRIKVANVDINTECGAGPLKMASWNNGLTLVFQEEQTQDNNWKFAGWFLGEKSDSSQNLTTMAGVGIGTTRKKMESAYQIEVIKTSLGYEFSAGDLYGIFDGRSKDAKITNMWSGVSCNFR